MTESAERQIQLLSDGELTSKSEVTTTSARDQGLEALKDIIYGSIAGVVGKTIEYPFDTVKVRLQSQSSIAPEYHGPLDCFKKSLQSGGLSSLYRGISAPLLGAAIETSSLFFSYRIAQDVFRATLSRHDGQPLQLSALVGCGAASGAFTSLLLTPIELVKCQMQVPVSPAAPVKLGPFQIVTGIYRHRGILGFWHGQLGTLIRETGGSAMWFGSYEGVSAIFRHYRNLKSKQDLSTPATITGDGLPVWQQMSAGAMAGMTYNFICYPADTIKSRMQTADFSQTLARSGKETFWGVGRSVWKQQGLRGLYQGCGLTVARAIPGSAFIFAVYERLRTLDREFFGEIAM